jgi:hypothetical protein
MGPVILEKCPEKLNKNAQALKSVTVRPVQALDTGARGAGYRSREHSCRFKGCPRIAAEMGTARIHSFDSSHTPFLS